MTSMTLKKLNPITPGSRHRVIIDYSKQSKLLKPSNKNEPLKRNTLKIMTAEGRNFRGVITTRHRGGGHKRLYRIIEFNRNKLGVSGKVNNIEYDPNRTANIARIHYQDGSKHYIIHPQGLEKGANIIASAIAPLSIGNSLPLKSIPIGTEIHNIEFHPGKGGQLARSAGTGALVSYKTNSLVTLKLPSGRYRHFNNKCWATIGKVSKAEHKFINLGKAGRSRWLGIRPTVRGSAQNAVDHPHGGGEGKAPIGRIPSTPWGKPALGIKTRRRHQWSERFFKGLRKK